ncbi:metallophosphoesterase [Candidatus Bathyarchaeota archaeon]|nr:metallophosphoesterase [Candidatus Bathyarchaeota archaeon]
MTRIFFATDVHGSEKCWKKFVNAGKFYKANISILGGDLTGKAVIPIVSEGNNIYKVNFLEQDFNLKSSEELAEMEYKIVNSGYYPYIVSREELKELSVNPDKVNKIFEQLMTERLENWLRFADEKLKGSGIKAYVCPGNDDPFIINELIKKSEVIENAEGKVVEVDSYHEMISSGWTNVTPWKTFRECSEEELERKIEEMTQKVNNLRNCIFNLHAPPYGSGLDEAPQLDESLKPIYGGQVLMPVGSKAVKEAIEKYQPLLGLHGHIHEGKGFSRIGRTLCINPGSSYEEGTLLGAIIDLDKGKIVRHMLATG